jgi:hypothetical protein
LAWLYRRTGRKRSAGSTRPAIKDTIKPTISLTILKARNSYVGFRNDEGRDAVVGLKLRMTALKIEPVGRTFQNSGERMAHLR